MVSQKHATYNPPKLPDYLASTYDLKPIVGGPADDDVKAIHTVIRAVSSVSHIPALSSPNLSTQLAQHLFNVQMAVYRRNYSYAIIPEDITYTPPTLPSHIPVELEPVAGPPSDEQLSSVLDAVRSLDSLANFRSMFDPDLSMKLSQHLFDIQLARYISQSMQGRFTSEPEQTQSLTQEAHETAYATSETEPTNESQSKVRSEAKPASPEEKSPHTLEQAIKPTPFSVLEQHSARPLHFPDATKVLIAQEEANRVLGEIGDVLKNVNRALVSIQHSQPQIWDSYALINQKGELPSKYNLPLLTYQYKRSSSGAGSHPYMRNSYSGADLTDQQLAAYLKFYEIGLNLIEDDGEPTIPPGNKQEAEILLYEHLQGRPGSGWAIQV